MDAYEKACRLGYGRSEMPDPAQDAAPLACEAIERAQAVEALLSAWEAPLSPQVTS